jgi:hypothetical protein
MGVVDTKFRDCAYVKNQAAYAQIKHVGLL